MIASRAHEDVPVTIGDRTLIRSPSREAQGRTAPAYGRGRRGTDVQAGCTITFDSERHSSCIDENSRNAAGD